MNEGHKVKITIMFRGREVYHPEHGKRILDRIAEQMEGIAKIEAEPKLDNRNMIMVLAPDKRARQAAASRTANQHRGEKQSAPATPPTSESAPTPAAAPAAAPTNGNEPVAGAVAAEPVPVPTDDAATIDDAATTEEG